MQYTPTSCWFSNLLCVFSAQSATTKAFLKPLDVSQQLILDIIPFFLILYSIFLSSCATMVVSINCPV